MTRHINEAGLGIIRAHEGLRLTSYDDAHPNRPLSEHSVVSGTLTIGYGHTGQDVYIGQEITREDAEYLLEQDCLDAEHAVSRQVKVPLSDNQFGALVCFTFNVGGVALAKSTLLRFLNAGDYQAAADQLLLWNKFQGRALDGLTARRTAERHLFLTPDDSEA